MSLVREVTDIWNVLMLIPPARIPGLDIELLPGSKWSRSRSGLQAGLIDRHLLDRRLFCTTGGGSASCPQKSAWPDGPGLMLCVTDLYSGRGVGLLPGALLWHAAATGPASGFSNVKSKSCEERTQVQSWSGAGSRAVRSPGEERLSTLVAASGAFPLALSPMAVTLRLPPKEYKLLLADGGVTDNSASALMLDADCHSKTLQQLSRWKLDMLVSSDAGALLAEENKVEPALGIVRAIDIIYANLGASSQTDRADGPKRYLLNPGLLVTHPQSLGAPNSEIKLTNEVETQIKDRLDERVGAWLLFGDSGAQRVASPDWRNRVRNTLIQSLRDFRATGTLESSPKAEIAASLYNLGRFLVAYYWEGIANGLVQAGSNSAGSQ